MTAPEEYTRLQAADPSTPQQTLADIAALREDLRPVVALNPAAYPGLLQWLASLGEPAVDTALRRRAGAVPDGVEDDEPAPWAVSTAQVGGAATHDGGPFAGQAAPYGGQGTLYGGQGAQYGGPPAQYAEPPAQYAEPPAQYAGPPGGPWSPAPVPARSSRTVLWVVLGVVGLVLVGAVGVVLVGLSAFRAAVDVTDPAVDRPGAVWDLGGETYGDDPALDALWDACAAEDWDACDDLYFESGGGTEYERFGETCGGRTDGTSLCSVELGGSLPGSSDDAGTYGDDPGLDALWDACGGGEAAACDELYSVSGIGTEYERFAMTCGGTREESYEPCAP
ncbi:hypothetical protein [Actinotalea sp. Marseille-Q4924]|uniref:variant leucine-rich repeat-containing protein n=1 Tax=Actinotalea sp. Marseille-Q4924 TaxID=2866571 RepID=UPI001CE3DBA6|nr:hypothetical protein [Actinotalea sp. Marseille-Q4924]